MILQSEKLEVDKMIIETEDKNIIREVKSLFKNQAKIIQTADSNEAFYNGFRNGIREVKSSIHGKTELKDAKTWLDQLPD